MICTDMRETRGNWTADRRFFGRGGELVYLMLNRSSLSAELMPLIHERLLAENDPMNRIAHALSDPADTGASNTQIGYLPHLSLASYESLAEDWLNILKCNRLPEGHLFEPLFRITGLNIVVYLAERAQDEVGAPQPVPIVVDLTDGGNQQLREEAKVHLNLHRDAANRAVRAFVERVLGGCDRWRMALERSDTGLAKQALRERFGFTKGDDPRGNAATPAQQLEAFIEHAMQRDKNNIYKYLLLLAKDSGLAT